ncbi:hypothetical protein YB2330_000565 [Saitoella coloradoensis]
MLETWVKNNLYGPLITGSVKFVEFNKVRKIFEEVYPMPHTAEPVTDNIHDHRKRVYRNNEGKRKQEPKGPQKARKERLAEDREECLKRAAKRVVLGKKTGHAVDDLQDDPL